MIPAYALRTISPTRAQKAPAGQHAQVTKTAQRAIDATRKVADALKRPFVVMASFPLRTMKAGKRNVRRQTLILTPHVISLRNALDSEQESSTNMAYAQINACAHISPISAYASKAPAGQNAIKMALDAQTAKHATPTTVNALMLTPHAEMVNAVLTRCILAQKIAFPIPARLE